MRILQRAMTAALALLSGSVGAIAQELVIWHDKGDDGLAMIDRFSDQFQETHPDVTVTSVSMPTEQWFSKSIAALNTGTGPDILFNDNTRIQTVQQSTGKLCELSEVVAALPEEDRQHLSEDDITAGTLEEEVLMVPFQRTMTGLGVRKSWLEAAGEEFPKTWEDVLRIGRAFQESDPDGNQQDDTYGLAMQGGDASSMINGGSLLLVIGGNREPYDLIDAEGNVVLANPDVAEPFTEYLKLYTEHGLVSPETINHTFTDMYQLIEGGRVGMFRVGNWNVGKWDEEALEGDYIVGPYPSMNGGEGALLVGSVRGMAVPCNGDNVELAKEFVSTIVSKEAQQASLEHMGGIVRDDLDLSGVTPGLTPFVSGEYPLVSGHYLSAQYPWYPELQDVAYAEMSDAIANPPEDWDAWVQGLAQDLQVKVDELKAE